MTIIQSLFQLLFDPRGRMSRAGMLVSASVLLAIEGAILLAAPQSAAGLPASWFALKCLALWVGLAGIIKRMHDSNVSAWWLLAGAGGLCVWSAVLSFGAVLAFGIETFNPATLVHMVLLALILLPALGMALWLHLAPGSPHANRFGPVPAGILDLPPKAAPTAVAFEAYKSP